MGCPLVPLNNAAFLDAYIQAGAREFYFGFYDPQWEEAFGRDADLNRMSGFQRTANAYSLAEALNLCSSIRMRGCSGYITFNTASYSAKTQPYLNYYFSLFAAAGAVGVILSGPEFIDDAKQYGLKAVASTMCGVFNSQLAQFYANCGTDRIILPRDLTLNEILTIVGKVPQVEYEAFLMRNGCVYSDSHCLGRHGGAMGSVCGHMRQSRRTLRTVDSMDELESNSALFLKSLHVHACGLCALWDLEQAGVSAYKIVGRCDGEDSILEDIRSVSINVAIASRCKTREEFHQSMVPHPYAQTVCVQKLNCYYPEVSTC